MLFINLAGKWQLRLTLQGSLMAGIPLHLGPVVGYSQFNSDKNTKPQKHSQVIPKSTEVNFVNLGLFSHRQDSSQWSNISYELGPVGLFVGHEYSRNGSLPLTPAITCRKVRRANKALKLIDKAESALQKNDLYRASKLLRKIEKKTDYSKNLWVK